MAEAAPIDFLITEEAFTSMISTTQIRSMIIAASAIASLLISSLAQAHISLMESAPAADTIVATPHHIDLIFNERLVSRASRVELKAMDGSNVEHIDIEFLNGGKTLRAVPHHPLVPGVYRVQWRAVGDDNHPMTGDFSFTVK